MGEGKMTQGWLRRSAIWLLVLNLIAFYVFFFVGLIVALESGVGHCNKPYEPYATFCGRLPVSSSDASLFQMHQPIYKILATLYLVAFPVWPGMHYGLFSGHEVAYMFFAWRYMVNEYYCFSPLGFDC